MDPALIYSVEQTGQVITSENENRLSTADVERFDRAIDEHRPERRGLLPTSW
jgi:hypothetical protein